MSEAIHKLQPDRTMQLRGFDGRGAAAAFHSATPDGFVVSGVFRDPADFCVLMLWDADNFFEHPRLKHLPDFELAGVKLEFDVEMTGLQGIDSTNYPSVAWNALQIVYEDGTTGSVLLRPMAAAVSGDYAPAFAEFELLNVPAVGKLVQLAWRGEYFNYTIGALDNRETAAAGLRDDINAGSTTLRARVGSAPNMIRLEMLDPETGDNGNRFGAYGLPQSYWYPLSQRFSGGASPTKWHLVVDFSTLPRTRIRKMWLTFAPAWQPGVFEAAGFEATFTNWTVTGDNRALKVAGAGSVRIEENDAWCKYSGASWGVESGFYSQGFSKRATTLGDSVEVTYHCQATHDLYLGTSLYSDRGSFGVSLDGGAESALDCHPPAWDPRESAVNTRRLVRVGVAAGKHVVRITHRGGGPAYFDFLEAAVLSDVPDALPARADLSPAIDYDTDHGYKLPPARLMWNFDKLGYAGPMNEYVGVFWWNQRKQVGEVKQDTTVDFVGTPTFSATTTLWLGDFAIYRYNLTDDTGTTIAAAFALIINELSAALWAVASGATLTIHGRSAHADYHAQVTGNPVEGDFRLVVNNRGLDAITGRWDIDEAQTPALNRGMRDWHADLFQECADRGREIVAAYSMELVNPPGAMAARFPDGAAVETATGFGVLKSTHCSFVSRTLAYQKRAFKETADLMAAAGLTPRLQFGEFSWWYFRNGGALDDPNVGMAYWDDETRELAGIALGRPLWQFKAPDDDPAQHQADANVLAGILVAYCQAIRAHVHLAHPNAEFELLLPLDVNHPFPVGRFGVGGRLNYAVNVPVEFLSPAIAPFDRIKIEALDFGAWSHNLDLSKWAMRWPYSQGTWSKSKCSYNMAVYLVLVVGGGSSRPVWEQELSAAIGEGLAGIVLWAFDHIGIYGWDTWKTIAAPAVQEN